MSGGLTEEKRKAELERYLSPLAVWALSFGCAVGWGSFVMPGTTFLPKAGPMGTALGIVIGALVMFVIGVNYHYLLNRYPDSGGTLTYAIKSFVYDHGFLSSWFLILVYVAIIWANATALPLIGRNLLGNIFLFGFHYTFLGYDVYFGEILLSVSAIVICGFVCIRGKRLATRLQILFALLLFGGVMIAAFEVFGRGQASLSSLSPAWAAGEQSPFRQVFTIVALSPWAFVGFESVYNSAASFRFSPKKTLGIITVSLITGTLVYVLLAEIAAGSVPEGCESWVSYIGNLGSFSGLKGLPVFFSVHEAMGNAGVVLLGAAAMAGILTGLIGNFIAAGHLLYAMADDGILPEWFGKLNQDAAPGNALLFLSGISLFIPFLGRTAIGWIVDVNTVGATIAYAYTSAVALHTARKEGNKTVQGTGMLGLAMSMFFFFYFMSWSAGVLSTESYLILATWSILGFLYFRHVFVRDRGKRFGKSTVVWISLLFLIFFTSLMWVKQATTEMTQTVISNVSKYYEEQNNDRDPETIRETEEYLTEQLMHARKVLTRNSMIQMLIIVASLAIMFSIYTAISKREKQMELEKIRAEESNRAKTIFFANMSHDIRTPMNAIIGYTDLAGREDVTLEEMRGYIRKIEGSSRHLLALINDVLEMSRIESGKMALEPVPIDLKKAMDEMRELFQTQMEEKDITYIVDTSEVKNRRVLCDKNRLNRILLNLISNACKFTPNGGRVTVVLRQEGEAAKETASYEIRVKDNGIGMSKEFTDKVFEAFERERSESNIEGTGLGMAITRNIVDLMGGSIRLKTAPGQGAEFVVRLTLALQEGADEEADREEEKEKPKSTADFHSMRLLLVEDIAINREIALMQLKSLGFTVDSVENGKEALERVASSEPGYYHAVLMDIQMPVMDGYEATEAIRALPDEALSKIPVIAMTANAFAEDVKRALDAGMNAHIAKPIDVSVMAGVLHEVLG